MPHFSRILAILGGKVDPAFDMWYIRIVSKADRVFYGSPTERIITLRITSERITSERINTERTTS